MPRLYFYFIRRPDLSADRQAGYSFIFRSAKNILVRGWRQILRLLGFVDAIRPGRIAANPFKSFSDSHQSKIKSTTSGEFYFIRGPDRT